MFVIVKHDGCVRLPSIENGVLECLNVRKVSPLLAFMSCRVVLPCRGVRFTSTATGRAKGGAVALLLSRKPPGLKLCLVFSTVVSATDISLDRQNVVNLYNSYGTKPDLVYDEAWLTLVNNATFDLHIYTHNQECLKVSFFGKH